MDPSFMKFLEDDEDESMHSGAAVDAFTAALNRDIEGGLSVAAHPSDPNVVGESSHGKSPGPMQLPGHWQSSTDDNLSQQSQQNEPLHLHSSEQQLSQTEQIEQGSSAIDQHEHDSNQPESGQRLLHSKQSHSDHQQLQTETNSFQLVEKDQVKNPELNPVQEPRLERTQHSESQRQPATQQLNNQQVSGSNDANNSIRRMRTAPTIPFHMLIPILRPNLDKDRSMQLHSVFSKLRSSEIGKEDFLRVIRNIVGDQMLRQAAHKVQLQLQAEAAQNQQTNPNQYSLQAQTASQQLSSRGAQFMPHPASSQNQKGQKSPPHQPHVPPPSVQMQTGTEFPNLENSGTRSREVENKQDVKGMHTSQMYSTNMNVINSERQNLSVPLPGNKQQHGQLPQTSFSMFGNTAGNFHAQAYPRPSVSSTTTSLKPEAQISQMRQASQAQGIGSTHSGVMNAPKYELQNSANETKRLHGASLTSRAFPSMGYVKQEVVENPVEPSQKFQFSAPDGSFGSVHIDKGNPTLGSLKDDRLDKQSSRIGFSTLTSTTGPYQVSGAMSTPAETNMQLHSHISSATQPSVAGVPTKTPPKKPTIGQKKPLETGGTSSPLSSKKQKTSGGFLDQSIEQLNDVTAVSGVNLREEEEQLLSAPKEDSRASEATRRVVQEEEERLILQKGPLHKKLTEIMSECGLEGIGSDVERCLSLCVEERLRGLISHLVRLSKQRVDTEKTRHRFVDTSDVRSQILLMNQKAKQEWDKKQAEAEKLRKINESEGNSGAETEKEKDENRSKTVKVNREEDDKMRTTAANVAARAAVGGDDMLSKWQLMAEQARQKRDGVDVGSTSQPSKTANRKTIPTFSKSLREQQETEKKGPSAGGTRKMGRNQAVAPEANISVKDVIAALEREPQMSKSDLIYRLYEKSAGDSAAE